MVRFSITQEEFVEPADGLAMVCKHSANFKIHLLTQASLLLNFLASELLCF